MQLYLYLPRTPRRESLISRIMVSLKESCRYMLRAISVVKPRLFPGRYQIGKKREVVAHIGPGVETDRMRLVLRITVQAAFITILVDRVQIEVDSRRQAGLVVEEVFDS